MSVEVEHEKCMRCGACVGTCPEDSLFLKEFCLEVYDSCIECGLCVKVCPVEALELGGE